MYERKYNIERFDADKQGRLKPSVLLNYLNDIMERNANSYGASASFYLKRDLAWVLVEYQLEIKQWPKAGESVLVGTLPYSFKRMVGFRIYTVTDLAGNTLIKGKGKFMLINIKTKKFVRPSQELLSMFTDAKTEPDALVFDRWPNTERLLIHTDHRRVSHDHIDVNNHVNNACYATFAYQALPDTVAKTMDVNRVFLKYKQETFYQDFLDIKVFKLDIGYHVDIVKDDGVVAEVLFQTKK